VNSTGSATSKNRSIDGLTFNDLADNIVIKLSEVENPDTFESSNYSFEFFTTNTFST
jgi:hypothetical protein